MIPMMPEAERENLLARVRTSEVMMASAKLLRTAATIVVDLESGRAIEQAAEELEKRAVLLAGAAHHMRGTMGMVRMAIASVLETVKEIGS